MTDETPSDETPQKGQITTDLDTIREWADDRNLVPVRTGEIDPEMEDSGIGSEAPVGLVPSRETDDHEEIGWETFHDELRDSDAAVVERGTGDRDRLAVVDYDDAIARMDLDREDFEERLMEGEVVRGEITETTVVETRVVEEAEIESELVDTDLVSERVLDAELIGRTCTNCEIVADDTADPMGMFDEARYLESRSRAGGLGDTRTSEREMEPGAGTERMEPGAGTERMEPGAGTPEGDETIDELAGTELEGDQPHDTEHGTTPETEHGTTPETEPYHAELSIDEEWQVTRELIERLTIETRIVDTDVTEFDSIEHAGFDVEGLQRTILESGIFEFETDPEKVLTEHEVRTELGEGDAVHTYLNRRQTVEDEVHDHRTARVPVADFEHTEMEVVDSMEIESGLVSEEPAADATASATGGPGAGESGMDEPSMDESGARDVDTTDEIEAGEMEEARSTLIDSDQGKAVVDATGSEVGMIVEVDESAGTAYVDPNPGIAERIMSKMGWGDADAEDYPLTEEQIQHITDDEVRLVGQGDERTDESR